MTFLFVISTALFIVFVGFIVLEIFGFLKKESLIGRLSIAWGLGVGMIGLQIFIH